MSNEITAAKTAALRTLRKLILAEVAFSVLGPIVALSDSRLLPPALRDYRAATKPPFSITDGIEMFAYCVCFALTVIGLVGLWRGSRSGRLTYLASWLLLLVLSLFGHPTVTSAPSMALAMLSTLLGGAIIGFVYSPHTFSTNVTGSA